MDPPKTSHTTESLRIVSGSWRNEMDVRMNSPMNTHIAELGGSGRVLCIHVTTDILYNLTQFNNLSLEYRMKSNVLQCGED